MNKKISLVFMAVLLSVNYLDASEKKQTKIFDNFVVNSLKKAGNWVLYNKGTVAGLGAVSYVSLASRVRVAASLRKVYYIPADGAIQTYFGVSEREREAWNFDLLEPGHELEVVYPLELIWYGTLAYLLGKSLSLGNKLSAEAQARGQQKGANEIDWTKRNSVNVDNVFYTKGYEFCLEKDEQTELQFCQTLKSILDSSNKKNTRATVNEAFQLIKEELHATFSDPSYKHYSNAGLKLSRFVWETKMGNKDYPENSATWLLDSDEAHILIEPLVEGTFFEDMLSDATFLHELGIIKKWYDPARLFSLQRTQKTFLHKKITWWQCSSLSRQGAALRAVALLKQYYFLLGLRTVLHKLAPKGTQYQVVRQDAGY